MCARFTLPSEDAVRRLLDVDFDFDFEIRYNVAPSLSIPCATRGPGGRELRPMVWGFTAFWSKAPLINAKSETARSSGAFKEAFAERRCLIPAAGFYEWREEGSIKQPYLFGMKGGEPFALGGLWQAEGEQEQCLVLTCEPNDLVARVHDRMPCIVPADDYEEWLSGTDAEAAQKMASLPFEAARMTMHPVTPRMNSTRYESPDCVTPAAPQATLFD